MIYTRLTHSKGTILHLDLHLLPFSPIPPPPHTPSHTATSSYPSPPISILIHFLQHDALGVRGSSEWVSLKSSPQMSLLVGLVVPPLVSSVHPQLAGSAQTLRLPWRETGSTERSHPAAVPQTHSASLRSTVRYNQRQHEVAYCEHAIRYHTAARDGSG